MLPSNTKGLKALHRVLIQARMMALDKADPQRLFLILDWAEVLPTYIWDAENRSAEFENALAGVSEDFPELSALLSEYQKDRI